VFFLSLMGDSGGWTTRQGWCPGPDDATGESVFEVVASNALVRP
jgi:hypothetical protein